MGDNIGNLGILGRVIILINNKFVLNSELPVFKEDIYIPETIKYW